MNHSRILFPLQAALLLSCACTQIDLSKPTRLSIEQAGLSISGATINLVLTGDMPDSCRTSAAVLKSEFDATSATSEELCAYLDDNGKPVTLPCSLQYENLQPSSEYLVIVEWSSGGQKHYEIGSFLTLAPAELSFSLSIDDAIWKKSDMAGIVSYDRIETSNDNVTASFAFTGASGEAVFLPSSDILMPNLGLERFYVYFPFDNSVFYNETDFCIHALVADSQVYDPESCAHHAWGVCDVSNSSANIATSLKEALASLDFTINLSEYPGYSLQKISILDAHGRASLSGEYAVDPEKEIVRPIAGKVNSSVSAKPVSPSAEGKVCVTLIPGDYSSADIILLVYLENGEGKVHIVPVKYNGTPLNLEPGDVLKIDIESLEAAQNPYPWFEYNESRDLLDGVAYGSQNTFPVEEGGCVSFEVKARGDILKAKTPKYYGIMLASNLKDAKLLQMPDGTDSYEPSPAREIPSDYRITVNCLSGTSASFGVVAIYDEEKNVLWSYMIWKHKKGDPIAEVRYKGIDDYAFMDRALGARQSIASALKEGKALEGAAYFNWGRKDPFPWKNQVPTHYLTEVCTGHDLQYLITHPNIKMMDSGNGNVYEGQRKDLWGAENKTTGENRNIKGHKTIYDPCPEGYMVPDYGVLCRISDKKLMAEIEFDSNNPRYALQHDYSTPHLELPCPFSDMSAFAIEKAEGGYDYWLYHGNLWSDSGWMNATTDAVRVSYCYWSNTNQNTSNNRASIIRGWYNGGGTKWFLDYSDKMAGAYPVRCQKENR